jgi:NTP pyrophosphatase (non-canonical NTP hydrolase)
MTSTLVDTSASVSARLEVREEGRVSDIEDLMDEARQFAEVRHWNEFHTPKNLAMAIAGEAGELVAEFRWLTPDAAQLDALSDEHLGLIRDEIADVFIFLLRLADVLAVDLAAAVRSKLARNESRFPRPD